MVVAILSSSSEGRWFRGNSYPAFRVAHVRNRSRAGRIDERRVRRDERQPLPVADV